MSDTAGEAKNFKESMTEADWRPAISVLKMKREVFYGEITSPMPRAFEHDFDQTAFDEISGACAYGGLGTLRVLVPVGGFAGASSFTSSAIFINQWTVLGAIQVPSDY